MILNRVTFAILATILSALLLVGCGGDSSSEDSADAKKASSAPAMSKGDYEAEVQEIGDAVAAELAKLDEGSPTTADFATAQKALDSAVGKLEDITPPSEVADLHDDLMAALRDTSDLFDRMAPLMEQVAENPAGLGDDEVEKMTAIQDDFTKLEERMTAVEDGFKAKQYDVGLGSQE
jgi:hypothetical protein